MTTPLILTPQERMQLDNIRLRAQHLEAQIGLLRYQEIYAVLEICARHGLPLREAMAYRYEMGQGQLCRRPPAPHEGDNASGIHADVTQRHAAPGEAPAGL